MSSIQLQVLIDRAEIAQLCDRYAMHLDRDRDNDDWLSSVFTDDARLVFPTGEYQGMAGLIEFQQMGRENFESSHHISANHYIELEGDRALVRGHLIAVHVRRRAEPGRHFDIGGHYDAEAVRTPDGWRFRSFDFALAWIDGEVPAQVSASS
jgi:SnoaL-like domain